MTVDENLLRRLARSSGLTRAEVRRFMQMDIISFQAGEVEPILVPRLRRAHRLRRDLGLQLEAIGIILRLLDRIETLEGSGHRGPTPRVTSDRR